MRRSSEMKIREGVVSSCKQEESMEEDGHNTYLQGHSEVIFARR